MVFGKNISKFATFSIYIYILPGGTGIGTGGCIIPPAPNVGMATPGTGGGNCGDPDPIAGLLSEPAPPRPEGVATPGGA